MARTRRAARLEVRMSRDELRALDRLAGARRVSRSRLIRQLVAAAEVEDGILPGFLDAGASASPTWTRSRAPRTPGDKPREPRAARACPTPTQAAQRSSRSGEALGRHQPLQLPDQRRAPPARPLGVERPPSPPRARRSMSAGTTRSRPRATRPDPRPPQTRATPSCVPRLASLRSARFEASSHAASRASASVERVCLAWPQP
jgi:Ribbon-helix-helix protein, copG family